MDVFDRISAGREYVNLEQFTQFLRNTFLGCDEDQHFKDRARDIFKRSCDDEALTRSDFLSLWEAILKKCIKPRTAVVVVDFQNDFIDGSLSLKQCPLGHDPEVLLPGLNDLISKSDEVVYTSDWHPENHISFIDCRYMWKLHESNKINPAAVGVGEELVFEVGNGKSYPQKMWPRHCVKDTEGAKLHKNLKLKENAITVFKGTQAEVDSYSAFWDNTYQKESDLRESLEARNITNLLIVGIAFDACVVATARDAISAGFTTSVVEDLTAAISEATTLQARAELSKLHCPRIASEQALQLLSSHPLPWILVWQQVKRLHRPTLLSKPEPVIR